VSRFVLVHGAWHGAWCWEQVVPRLAARGHAVRAIDLPGHGADPAPPGAVDWDDYMGRMGEVIADGDEPPILVGHSLGGAVISGAADRWPGRIRALVYLCAMLPDAPDFFTRFQATSVLSAGIRPAPDGSLMELDPAVVREAFYHDCSDEDAARAAARLRPQPARAFAMSFELAPDRFGRVPRHYIECREDRAIDIATQRAMHAKMPCTVHTLDASHSPFFSMPDRLAEVLERVARGVDERVA
jgi:pimeloyl-ACP methyl ester carboxylesterase